MNLSWSKKHHKKEVMDGGVFPAHTQYTAFHSEAVPISEYLESHGYHVLKPTKNTPTRVVVFTFNKSDRKPPTSIRIAKRKSVKAKGVTDG